MNHYKKNIAAGVLFIFCLLALDRIIFYVCTIAYKHITIEESGGNIEEALACKADVLVIGNSRARTHYATKLLQKKLGTTVYNLGADGQGIAYMRGALDIVLQKYTPSIVIFDITPLYLASSYFQKNVRRVAVLAPYLDMSSVVKKIIYNLSVFERVKYGIFKSVRFNDLPLRFLYNWLKKPAKIVSGFAPARGRGLDTDAVIKIREKDYAINPQASGLLRDALQQARKRKVRMLLVESPQWKHPSQYGPNETRLKKALQELAAEEKVPYIRITSDNYSFFQNPKLFSDSSHMNLKGAILFSQILAKQLVDMGLVTSTGNP